MQTERRITRRGLLKTSSSFRIRFSTNSKHLKTGYSQAMAKIDALIASQKTPEFSPRPLLPSKCKFCGSKIEKGYFCPRCKSLRVKRAQSTGGDMWAHIGMLPPSYECPTAAGKNA
jgi:hypothetical protein